MVMLVMGVSSFQTSSHILILAVIEKVIDQSYKLKVNDER